MSSFNWEKFGIEGIPHGRTSGNIKVYCPQCREQRHDKRDKSLSCNLATGAFNCHYCGFAGNATEYTDDEKKRWMEQQPWFTPKQIRREPKTYKKPKSTGSPRLSDRAVAWFASRGISTATLTAMRITEATTSLSATFIWQP